MRIQSVIHILGLLLFFLGLSMLLPLTYSIACSESCWNGIFYSFIITSASGAVIYLLTKIKNEIRAKEGFAIVAFGWFLLSLFGMIPFLLTGSINTLVDAFLKPLQDLPLPGLQYLLMLKFFRKAYCYGEARFNGWAGWELLLCLSQFSRYWV